MDANRHGKIQDGPIGTLQRSGPEVVVKYATCVVVKMGFSNGAQERRHPIGAQVVDLQLH